MARKSHPKPQLQPNRAMRKLAESLFDDPSEIEAFLAALVAGQSRDQAIVVLQDKPEIAAFPKRRPQKWQAPFVHRLMGGFLPTKHALYAKGAFYSLDSSSAFAASAMLAIPEPPKRVLDMCSAPGGKAVFAWRAFAPELLVCNETIRKRCGTLIDNLKRCEVRSAQVASADSSVWARKAAGAFDFVIVDAPCSGQSLLAKGDIADGCFDPEMIDLCVGRQRRIVANSAKCVRPGGHLLYMTCTFSRKENEKVLEWLLAQDPDLEAVACVNLCEFQSKLSGQPCYRLFPHLGMGAGAFSALVRRREGAVAPEEAGQFPCFWRFADGLPAKKASHFVPQTVVSHVKP